MPAPKILSDGTLLYECILCHQHKPFNMMEYHNGIYFCKSCPDILHPEITVIQSPEINPIIIPTPVEFNTFFDDTVFFKIEPIPSLINNTIILTNPKTNKSIKLNTTALLQILVDKFNHPVIHESYVTQNIDLQTKMQNLYADIQEKSDHDILKFNKILPFEDKRIKDLCESYATMFIIPLKLKIQYQEWEKTLISGYISSEISKGMSENNKKLSEIQQDYAKKLEEEKVKNNTKLENYSNEIRRLQGMNESLNSMRSSSKEELNSIKLEKDELYDKYKKLELQLQEKDTEAIKLKFDLEKSKRELEKHKIVEEWMLDPTSSEKEQIYFNQVTGEHITYPENFKENYKPESVDMDNDILIYKEKTGDKEFKLPKSLLRFVKSQSISENGININKIGKKLKENSIKILNILSRDKKDAPIRKEICERTKIPQSHVGEYLKELIESNLIVLFEDESKDERFYRI